MKLKSMLINKVEEYLESNTPFAFVRFNDGEMGGIVEEEFVASRGAQKIDADLQKKLKEAIAFKKENYWIGLPCPQCYPTYYQKAQELVGDYEFKTLAVELINENYNKTKNIFKKHLKGKKIYWVGGEDQTLDSFIEKYNADIAKHYKLPTQNAFSSYDLIFDKYRKFEPGSIVILSLGPLERVLTKEWFELNDTVTYLGLGSFFDPITRNVSHRYHTGNLESCYICNCKSLTSKLTRFFKEIPDIY